jgi:phenylpyruvate tautomerase PptA (4-oxalocrotonate tautomerase family)
MLVSEGPRSGVHINHRQQRNLFQIRLLESGPPEQDDRSHPSPTSHVRVVPYRGHRPLLGLALRGQHNLSNVDGESGYVRVQVLTNAGALDRDKQLAVVSQFTSMVADAAGDPALAGRTWVLLTEAVPGGWGCGVCEHQ